MNPSGQRTEWTADIEASAVVLVSVSSMAESVPTVDSSSQDKTLEMRQ